jgi:uncharacterized protein YdhG (YjbR/CyaY superfamily)
MQFARRFRKLSKALVMVCRPSLDGKNFIWYGAWKNHISFYPIRDATRRALADEVAGYNTSGKGTIRFRSDEDLPTSLVVRLVRVRITELRKQALPNDVACGYGRP